MVIQGTKSSSDLEVSDPRECTTQVAKQGWLDRISRDRRLFSMNSMNYYLYSIVQPEHVPGKVGWPAKWMAVQRPNL